jgi:hypothetical protein
MPSTMAILLVARLHGRAEVWRLLRRLLMGRVGIFWYAAIVALTALMVVAVWVSTLFGAPAPIVVATITGTLSIFLFSIFPGSAVGEELGWRGFALPRLQGRHSALTASLIMGTIWGTYHFPLFLLGSPEPAARPVPPVRNQLRNPVDLLHLDVQRHRRQPAHRRAAPCRHEPATVGRVRASPGARPARLLDVQRHARPRRGRPNRPNRSRYAVPHSPKADRNALTLHGKPEVPTLFG